MHSIKIKSGKSSVHFFVGFEGFTEVTMRNTVFWDVGPRKSCVNDVLEERIVSIFRV
jgi:hypothetical protein